MRTKARILDGFAALGWSVDPPRRAACRTALCSIRTACRAVADAQPAPSRRADVIARCARRGTTRLHNAKRADERLAGARLRA